MRLRGELSKAMFDVYVWTRLACNAYGIAQISLEDIANDALTGDKNYANKILIELRRKKLIWYADRQGRRGSFEIHHDKFPMLNGQIKSLNKFFPTIPNFLRLHGYTICLLHLWQPTPAICG